MFRLPCSVFLLVCISVATSSVAVTPVHAQPTSLLGVTEAAAPAAPAMAAAPAAPARPRIRLETPATTASAPPPPVAAPSPAPRTWKERFAGLLSSITRWLPELFVQVTKWAGEFFSA